MSIRYYALKRESSGSAVQNVEKRLEPCRAMIRACSEGETSLALALIESGVDANISDDSGDSLLHVRILNILSSVSPYIPTVTLPSLFLLREHALDRIMKLCHSCCGMVRV
jgi:hypothetical protein